jgi:hypothetical protein
MLQSAPRRRQGKRNYFRGLSGTVKGLQHSNRAIVT